MAKVSEIYPSRFITAADLKGNDVSAVIDHVEMEVFEDNGRKQDKPVVFFQGGKKGLVCNKTNLTTIATIAGDGETDNWNGVKVVLYPTMVQFGAKMTEAIRVKAPAPNTAHAGQTPVQQAGAKPVAAELNDSIPF